MSTTTQIITKMIAEYFKTQPIMKAWLFGSFARGEETPESDVDLLVMGNEIIETPISLFASKPFSELLSSSFRTVNTYQRVDPFETAILDDIGFLNEMGGEKAYRGQTMMHEVTESYIGGLNALKTGKPAGNASVSRQEFEEAHKAATLQPVLPDIEQILEEFRIRRGK